jgi:hypothetical protein
MFNTLFGEGQLPLKMFLVFIVVFGAFALLWWLARRFGGPRLASASARGRQPRLAVIDITSVDSRRRLVLIRRDNVEHLLMTGGPSDLVIEPNIVRAAGAPREAAAGRQVSMSDTHPRTVPPAEGSMWPLQPDAAPKPEPSLRAEPAPPRQQRPPLPAAAPPVEEPAPRSAGELEVPQPQASAGRDRRARKDLLSGLAEELGRVSAQEGAPEPGARPAPRREQRARPQSPPAPPSVPLPEPRFNSHADQNLAEMAQRLEAALRRPGKVEEGRPPAPVAKPAAAAEQAAAPGEEADELNSIKAPSPPPRAAPVTEDPPIGRSDSRPAAQKSLYDSLEQEMASLLGRPTGKN